jgi:hypothetical protein
MGEHYGEEFLDYLRRVRTKLLKRSKRTIKLGIFLNKKFNMCLLSVESQNIRAMSWWYMVSILE